MREPNLPSPPPLRRGAQKKDSSDNFIDKTFTVMADLIVNGLSPSSAVLCVCVCVCVYWEHVISASPLLKKRYMLLNIKLTNDKCVMN